MKRATLAAAFALLSAAAAAAPVRVPFDFSRHEIGLSVQVRGQPLYMFLDTGVSPSAIDTGRARSIGLKIDPHGGEATGAGDAAHVVVYPTVIDGLVVGNRPFLPIEALAVDHAAISRAYGRPVDGTLGHSFLAGHALLIDYATASVAIADRGVELAPRAALCRTVWRLPLRSFKGDNIPMVDLVIGDTHLPASIDTGADDGVELFKGALDAPAVKKALVQSGTTRNTGARGESTLPVYRLDAPVRLGPFVLPAGQRVTLRSDGGSASTRLVNIGNKLLADMGVALLLDYRANTIAFLGKCGT